MNSPAFKTVWTGAVNYLPPQPLRQRIEAEAHKGHK